MDVFDRRTNSAGRPVYELEARLASDLRGPKEWVQAVHVRSLTSTTTTTTAPSTRRQLARPRPWTSRTRPRQDVRPACRTGVTWAKRRAAAADSDSALSTPRLRALHRTSSWTTTLRRCSRCCLGRRPPLRARAGAAYWVAVCSCIRCAASAAVRRVVAKKGNRRRRCGPVLTIRTTACQRPAAASTLAARS